jgi:hypothetical protein
MKKINYILAILLSLALFTSCKKEDNGSSSSSGSSTNISSIITSGTWKVSYYHHNSDDNTADFTGYTFTFNSNGTMTAINSDTTNGTWSKDDSHSEVHFSIGSTAPLSKLTSGWTVISATTTQMVFKDDSSSTEEVHFTKI